MSEKSANRTCGLAVALEMPLGEMQIDGSYFEVAMTEQYLDAEPLQFYAGRDHLLYEVVIWTTENNRVTGYLSTPKSVTIAASN